MSDNPPKLFGSLLTLFGLALFIAQLLTGLPAHTGDYYFIVVGLGYVLSGVLFFLGRSTAPLISMLTLLVVWGWSLFDLGAARMSDLVMRVGMPTLIGAYIYFSNVRSRLQPEVVEVDARNLTDKQARVLDRVTDTAFSATLWTVKALTAILLIYAANDALETLNRIATFDPSIRSAPRVLWMLAPTLFLTVVLFIGERVQVGHWSLLFVAIMTTLFGMGVYTMIPDHPSVPGDTGALNWVPMAQLLWSGICLYVVATRFPIADE